MTTSRWIPGAAALFLLSGCFSAPKPFTQTVISAPLRAVGGSALAPAALPGDGRTGTLAPDIDLEVADDGASLETAPEQEPEPARVNIQGEGDGSMKIDRVVVSSRQIAHRVPDYTSEQTASMVCMARKMNFGGANAQRAHEATLAVESLSARFDQGGVSFREMEDAEQKRQSAVRSFTMPIPLVGLFFNGAQKKNDLPAPRSGDVVIENADLFIFTEFGKEVMAVSGVARNTGAQRAELPPVTLAALDAWEFQLAGQTSLLPFEALAPGEAREFEVRFNNPPATTAEVYVHFAPPFSYRSRRDCDSFDPAAGASDTLDAGPVGTPTAAVNAKPATHSAAELNILTQYYRRESAEAWRCRDWTAKGCSWARNALRWRDMFVMSEAIDAAWIAQRAAVAAPDNAAAETARATAFAAFAQLGDDALARAGASAPDIAVSLSTSTYGRDRDGLYVEIAGSVTNTGPDPRRIDALMLAFVDRLDLPLSSMAVDFVHTLAPGTSAPFHERVTVAEGADPDRPWGRRGANDDALARVPPQSIPWQVRVGAMAR